MINKKGTLLFLLIGSLVVVSAWNVKPKYKIRLSEYGFFSDLPGQVPAEGVIPYSLNTPLFSDYAQKLRFIQVPEGGTLTYNDSAVFDMPIGTKIIKTFYYYHSEKKKEKGRKLIETRLLLHEENGWVALPYIWNDEQTDATLQVAGDIKEVSWTNEKGKKMKIDYLIPNKNQCKGCHLSEDKLQPIGPAARHLNRTFEYPGGAKNQLELLVSMGKLSGMPALEKVPKNIEWEAPSDATIADRARSWLDINCGHCHSPQGPANTSGLFLDIHETDPYKLGVMKPPVAAGRGAGERLYDIVPGKPDESILVYRMESNDPGIRMPEIGRSIQHKEGLDVIREWIKEMQ